MKYVLRKTLAFLICISMMLMLCSCDSGKIDTVLTLNDAFSGSRVISFDVKKSDLGGVLSLGGVLNNLIGAPTVESIVDTLEASCPPELTMSSTKNGNDAHCDFALTFSAQQEYENKVASLLGRNPSVRYEGPSEDIFVSGITLKEDFSSAELMTWASDALKEAFPKYADKVNISDTKGTTTVDFNGTKYTAGSVIDISPAFTPLDRVIVNTVRYGDNDYVRTVEVRITEENLSLIGRDNLTDNFLSPLTAGIGDIASAGWKDGSYVISMRQGSLKDLEKFTSAVFAGSTLSYDADSDVGAFTESGTLNEDLIFDGFVCGEDYKANVTMIYTTTDETKFMDGGDGTLAADGKTYTIVADGCTEKSATIVSETRYVLEGISVSESISLMGNNTVAVVLDYPVQSSRSASELAAAYFSKAFEGTGMNVDVRTTGIAEESSAAVIGAKPVSGSDTASKYSVVFSVAGKLEDINPVLVAAFGPGNSVSVEDGEFLKLYIDHAVTHTVDLSEIIGLAEYGGNVTYTFSGDYTKVKNVKWQDANGVVSNDVLSGQENKETFSEPNLPAVPFTITYQYSSINILLILIALAAGVGIMCVLMFISNIFNKRIRANRKKKKEAEAVEAVKCVALAALPEDKRGELRELPKELTQRPMVVLEPRNDDGLDEDDDDPEGVQIFATTLRLLAITVAVLFFFPFCNIQKSSLLGNSATLSGWNLFYGKEIFGVQVEPYRFAVILLAIPVVVLILLLARRSLPRLVIPVFITASSLLACFYLLQLPDILNARIDTLKNAVNDYVTDPAFQMGYTYSMIIYVLLALGGVMLLFSDLSFVLAQKRKANDK